METTIHEEQELVKALQQKDGLQTVARMLMQHEKAMSETDRRLRQMEVWMQEQVQESQVGGPGDSDPPHPYGICGDETCASCVSTAQEIATRARRQALDDVESALLRAGGQQLLDQVLTVVQQGWQQIMDERMVVPVTGG